MLTALLIGMLTSVFNIRPVKSEPKTIVVPDDCPTIQQAIDNATDGDTIFVRNGTYIENVTIDKRVSLIGENKESTIVYDYSWDVMKVVADNVTINNFTLESPPGTRGFSVHILNAENCNVSGNKLIAWKAGVYIEEASNNCISDNYITADPDYYFVFGIWLDRSSNNIICGNNITAVNYYGSSICIYLDRSSDNNLSGNTMTCNYQGLFVVGSPLEHVNHVDASNTVNGKPIYYWINERDKTIPVDAGYVALVNCTGITVQDLSLANGLNDILVVSTENTTITRNTAHGIFLRWSLNNTISKNNIFWNDFWRQDWRTRGILLENSSSNTIFENKIENDEGYAIELRDLLYGYSSNNNMFYHNNLLTSSPVTTTSNSGSGNIWNNGYPSGGNYWSIYNGIDLFSGPYQNETGSDGIGDAPQPIGDDVDHYPLMKPYSGPHDIGATITASKTVVGQGYNTTVVISVTIINYGEETETFNFTFQTPAAVHEEVGLTLASRDSATFTFEWNTTGSAKGNYTITAYLTPVDGETDTTDNNQTRWIIITIAGDVTSFNPGVPDYKVDMRDIGALCNRFGAKPSSPNWNPNYDVNNDGRVDMRDIGIACNNFGKDP